MPSLPPKPKGRAVASQVLVVAALAASGCARHRQVRIGQPPPPRIGAQVCSTSVLQIVDPEGKAVAGVELRLDGGETLVSDANGVIATSRPAVVGTIVHPGYAQTQVALECGEAILALEPVEQPIDGLTVPPQEALDRPQPRIGRAPPLHDTQIPPIPDPQIP